MLRAGERVSTAGGGGGAGLVFTSDGSRVGRLLLELLREAVKPYGGVEAAFK